MDLPKSFRVLLTPTERKKPWILYMTPGLMLTEILHLGLVILLLSPLHRLLLPAVVNPDLDLADISIWKAVVYFIIVAIATIVLAPLEVIATRLAIQRNHASSEYNSVPQGAENDGEDTVEYSGTDEDVIGCVLPSFLTPKRKTNLFPSLRHEGDPYNGLVDCAKRIMDEEGIMTLYRAWWVTLLGGLASAFA